MIERECRYWSEKKRGKNWEDKKNRGGRGGRREKKMMEHCERGTECGNSNRYADFSELRNEQYVKKSGTWTDGQALVQKANTGRTTHRHTYTGTRTDRDKDKDKGMRCDAMRCS